MVGLIIFNISLIRTSLLLYQQIMKRLVKDVSLISYSEKSVKFYFDYTRDDVVGVSAEFCPVSVLIYCGLSLWLQRNTWQNHFWPDSFKFIQRLLPAPEHKHTLWRWNQQFVFPLVIVGREPTVATPAAPNSSSRRKNSVSAWNVRWIFSLINLDVAVWADGVGSFGLPAQSEPSNNGAALFVFVARSRADRIWLSRAELSYSSVRHLVANYTNWIKFSLWWIHYR